MEGTPKLEVVLRAAPNPEGPGLPDVGEAAAPLALHLERGVSEGGGEGRPEPLDLSRCQGPQVCA